jgi:hypothetical protein
MRSRSLEVVELGGAEVALVVFEVLQHFSSLSKVVIAGLVVGFDCF